MTKGSQARLRLVNSRSNTPSLAGIKVRPKVVPSDSATGNPLDVEYPLCRNAAIDPFRDRLRGYADSSGQVGLGAEFLEDWSEDIFAHDSSLIHRPFMTINDAVIASPAAGVNHKAMVDNNKLPLPENYASFSVWMKALAVYAGSQANLARAAKVSPQMITKYLSGGGPNTESLQKFADYAGVSYAKLRLLVDGKPLSEAKAIKDRINQTATPMGAQIGRKWETIQDERTRGLIAQQIEHALDQEKRLEHTGKKRAG